MNLPQKLQEYRQREKLSQEDLANQLGVSRQSVSKWEQGLSFPETEKLIVLSNMMGVSIDSLLKDEEAQEPAPTLVEPPVKRSPLTIVLAVLLSVTALALAVVLWQNRETSQQAEQTDPEESTLSQEQTIPEDETTVSVQTNFESRYLDDLQAWFFEFARDYRLDYMPQFPQESGAPTDSGEYLYWAYAVKPNKEGGTMTKTYVEQTVQQYYDVLPDQHRSHHKQWTYDEETEIYTAWPEGMKELPYFLLNSIEIHPGYFIIRATSYMTRSYLAGEEDDEIVRQMLLDGQTDGLVVESEVILTFRLDQFDPLDPQYAPGEPIFMGYTVTEYE